MENIRYNIKKDYISGGKLSKTLEPNEAFDYILLDYNREFEIKDSLEQKASILLTAIGIYMSILFINVFSNTVTRYTDFGKISSTEFSNKIQFDINLIVSIIITAIIIKLYVYKEKGINKNDILIFVSFTTILLPIYMIISYIIYNNNAFIIDTKAISFNVILFFLLNAIYFLIKCIKNLQYDGPPRGNFQSLLKSISEYTYEGVLVSLNVFIEHNRQNNKNKAKWYDISLKSFFIMIIFTIIYVTI